MQRGKLSICVTSYVARAAMVRDRTHAIVRIVSDWTRGSRSTSLGPRSDDDAREESALIPPVDVRSDTVTRPTVAMRRAIASAVVGDDVIGDDPTTIELERRVAQLCGKEAALFVPSGTMGNQLGIAVSTQPG